MLAVYVMHGGILAAHSSQDRERLLALLRNSGAVEESRLLAMRRAQASGMTITEELFEFVPDDLLQHLMAERFRENLFQFLQCAGPARFEAMEAVFVENIQFGHESRPLIETLDQLIGTTARLREPPLLVLAPGVGTARDERHIRLTGLCNPRLPLADLVSRSPFEQGRTLALVTEMLESGIVIPVSTTDTSTTGRPRVRPDAAAKVLVDAGRPEFSRGGTVGSREAVVAALADAVSAAVAKVGRQRDAPSGPDAGSAIDAISAPIAKKSSVAAVGLPGKSVVVHSIPSPRPLPDYAAESPTEAFDDEMAAFQDYDAQRVGGEFITQTELLDRVELDTSVSDRAGRVEELPGDAGNVTIEMEDAEHARPHELASAVSLNFAGPKLADEDARRRVDVANDLLVNLVLALDRVGGAGSGQPAAQLLVEGTPGAFASLFKGVEVDASGRLPVDAVLKNLRKRPASEHRRLLNRGLVDLVERGLWLASEELDDTAIEALLVIVAGYQQRLAM
ncbi:MAG: hypothetical protein EXR71_07260 [Myxococcales bacterium]|nr:hypothetical protein [Myxococcales bacterium]